MQRWLAYFDEASNKHHEIYSNMFVFHFVSHETSTPTPTFIARYQPLRTRFAQREN